MSSHAEMGGSERYLVDLVSHLGEDSVDRVVSLASGPLVAKLEKVGAKVEILGTGAGAAAILRSAFALRRLVARRSPDLIHANGVKAALVCSLARLNPPVVWAKHDFSWDGALARWIAGRCRLVVGVSRAVLVSIEGADTRVVMPGIEPMSAVDVSGADALHQMDIEGPAVLLIGRVHPVKGHRELIEAGPEVLRACPDVRFVFVGGVDPEHEDYAQEMRNLGEKRLGKAAVWTGYRDDLLALLAASAVTVIVTGSDERAPRPEGFGYVAVESMALGTPVVAYASGATPEVLGDCGHLVPPGDRKTLAESLVRLLSDKEERARLAGCGKARVAEIFAMERFISDMRGVYEEASS